MRLADLPSNIRKEELKEIAKWVIKYRNFKTRVALENKPKTQMISNKDGNMGRIYDYGLRYLNKREKQNAATFGALYDSLDYWMEQHVQPLTPKESEKRRIYKRTKKALTKDAYGLKPEPGYNVAKAVEQIEKKGKATYYGVQVKDNLKLFNCEEDAVKFCDGMNYLAMISNNSSKAEVHRIIFEDLCV